MYKIILEASALILNLVSALSPSEFAEIYVKQGKDRQDILMRVNNETVDGVIARQNIQQNEVLCEYSGNLLTTFPEGIKDESKLFEFEFQNKKYWIDDTGHESRMCYFIGDDPETPNAKMEVREYEGRPYLWLVASQDIPKDEEIRYNHGNAEEEDEFQPPQEQLDIGAKYVLENKDREDIEVKLVTPEIGRGLFATKDIKRGEFLCDYHGNFSDVYPSYLKEETYLFELEHKGKSYWIEATEDNGRICRLVNDNHINPNSEMIIHEFQGKPYVWLFALRDIKAGEEIRFNYGDNDQYWRQNDTDKKVASITTSPEEEAIAGSYVLANKDREDLEVKNVSKEIGRGVFATRAFKSGEFLCDYYGNFSTEYPKNITSETYLFEFELEGKKYWIDASAESGRVCRLINDEHYDPNAEMLIKVFQGKPYLWLFAIKDIQPGEEIRYDYGENEQAWRKTVSQESPDVCYPVVPPKPPHEMALYYVTNDVDRHDIYVKETDRTFGGGLFSNQFIKSGDFICHFTGNFLETAPTDENDNSFIFEVMKQDGQLTWFDSTKNDGRVCRMANDDHVNPNAYVAIEEINGKLYLLMYALRNISRGAEIRYKYHGENFPWRQVEEKCSKDDCKAVTPPEKAKQYIRAGKDREDLVADSVDPYTGRGVFTTVDIKKDEFICDYTGAFYTERPCLDSKEYAFVYVWNGKRNWIDAINEDGRLCRLVNDCHDNPNTFAQVYEIDGKPYALLAAKYDIPKGSEIRFSYSSYMYWWRTCNYDCNSCAQITFMRWMRHKIARSNPSCNC